jgi:Tol biopolymer transport system component
LRRAGAVLALAALAVASPAAAQQRRPMTFEDMISVRGVADPRISPDGSLIAFTVSTPSLGENRTVSRIWTVPSGGGQAKQLTSGDGSDRAPRWAPDGKTLAFISTRDGGAQVWRVAAGGGEPARLTAVPRGVNDFEWSPDGKALYLVADVKWPLMQEIDRRTEDYPTAARIATSLFYRHWNEWRAGVRQHVLRYSFSDSRASDITPIDHDVPTIALGGRDLAFSSVGSELAVAYNADSVVATSTNNDVFVMAPDGSGRQPITTNRANDHSPAYSPDGRYIA